MASFPLKFKLSELVNEDIQPQLNAVKEALKLVNDEGNWPHDTLPYGEFVKVITHDLLEDIPKAIEYTKEVVTSHERIQDKLLVVNLYYEIPKPDDMILNSLNQMRQQIGRLSDPILGTFLIGYID
jgi:hypothetical protein